MTTDRALHQSGVTIPEERDTDPGAAAGAGSSLRERSGWLRDWVTPHRVAVASVLTAALAFYMWTAATSVPFSFSSKNGDVYNQLTTSFLHGHTYLPIRVPDGLAKLANPYDPTRNFRYQQGIYHDLAFHNGRFYSSWGLTPALTLFLPFRLTTLRMSESFAVVLYGFVGLLCAVLLLHVLARRFVPKAPDWLLVAATIGLALSNVVPFILRRPAVYEVAISAGYCFAMAGLLLIARALLAASPRRLQLALGSLCLGLAVGGRISLAPLGLVAVGAAIYLVRERRAPYRILVPVLGPLIACALLLGAYNAVRFGSPTEIGQKYVLAGVDQTKLPYNQLSYIPPGAFSYLLLPPRPALTFPHVFLMDDTSYPFSLPRHYAGTRSGVAPEPAAGLLPSAPITILLLLIPILWWRWESARKPVLLVATALAGLGLVIVGGLSWGLFGSTQRYEVDYSTLFLIAAFLVWAALVAHTGERRRVRRAIGSAGVALTALGAAVGTALSLTGYWDLLHLKHPSTFRTLEAMTSPFATLATMIADKPVLVRVDAGAIPVELVKPGYGTSGERGASTWLGGRGPVTVTVISPGAQRTTLRTAAIIGTSALNRATVKVRIQSPGRSVTIPAIHGYMALPIQLHWGLNRIKLSVAERGLTGPNVVWLGNILVAPSDGSNRS